MLRQSNLMKEQSVSRKKQERKKKDAHACVGLATVFCEIAKAKEYFEKALAIAIEIGSRNGEGTNYASLGTVFKSLGDYVTEPKEYLEALGIAIEIGDRNLEGSCYGNLGTVFKSLGDYVEAKEYLEKALAIVI